MKDYRTGGVEGIVCASHAKKGRRKESSKQFVVMGYDRILNPPFLHSTMIVTSSCNYIGVWREYSGNLNPTRLQLVILPVSIHWRCDPAWH